MSFSRIRAGIGKRTQDGLSSEDVINKLKQGPKIDTASLEKRIAEGGDVEVPEGTYIHKVPHRPELGETGKYNIHEIETVERSAYGDKARDAYGSSSNESLRLALKAGDIRTKAGDRTCLLYTSPSPRDS